VYDLKQLKDGLGSTFIHGVHITTGQQGWQYRLLPAPAAAPKPACLLHGGYVGKAYVGSTSALQNTPSVVVEAACCLHLLMEP
jgi:hypothetical protein